MNVYSLIKDHRSDFIALCKRHHVSKLFAFGSAITDRFDPLKSDIDLLVELNIENPLEYGETLLALWDALEQFFNRKVDLVTEDSVQNPFLKKSIDSSKQLIYDRQGEKVFV